MKVNVVFSLNCEYDIPREEIDKMIAKCNDEDNLTNEMEWWKFFNDKNSVIQDLAKVTDADEITITGIYQGLVFDSEKWWHFAEEDLDETIWEF